MILDGAFQKVVEIGRPIPGKTAGDAGIVPEAFGGAGESLAAVGVVLETGLGLEGAVVEEAVFVDEGGVEALAAVFGVEFVFGVGGAQGGREGEVREEGVGEEGEGDADGGKEGGHVFFEV